MAAAKVLMASSAMIALLLGVIHWVYTFSGTNLLPRDSSLRAAMSEAPLSITRETTVFRAWLGFNASHSMGLLLFGLLFGFLALYHPELLFGSAFLLAVGFATLAGYLVLCKLYWFSVPLAGVILALVCYAASIVAARA